MRSHTGQRHRLSCRLQQVADCCGAARQDSKVQEGASILKCTEGTALTFAPTGQTRHRDLTHKDSSHCHQQQDWPWHRAACKAARPSSLQTLPLTAAKTPCALAYLCLRIDNCPVVQQAAHNVLMSFPGCKMQRSPAILHEACNTHEVSATEGCSICLLAGKAIHIDMC